MLKGSLLQSQDCTQIQAQDLTNLPIVSLLHMISAGPLAASTFTVLQTGENISMKERSILGCWQWCVPQTLACCRQRSELCRGGTRCSFCLDMKHLAGKGCTGTVSVSLWCFTKQGKNRFLCFFESSMCLSQTVG